MRVLYTVISQSGVSAWKPWRLLFGAVAARWLGIRFDRVLFRTTPIRDAVLTNPEVRLTLDIPDSVILPDGTTAQVKAVAATVNAGQLERVTYTVESETGAWRDITGEELRRELSDTH